MNGVDTSRSSAEQILTTILVRNLVQQGIPAEEAAKRIEQIRDLPQFERGDHVDVADYVTKSLGRSGPPVVFADGEVWRYVAHTGLWQIIPREEIGRVISKLAGAIAGKNRLRINSNDIAGVTKVVSILTSDADFFSKAASGLACTNGFARVENGEIRLVDHDANHRARVPVPFAYEPVPSWDELEARAPRFAAFLRAVFPEAEDGHAKIEFMQEFFGASLAGVVTRFQKCVMLYGEGANGKSTLLHIVERIFPRGTVVAIPPHEFGQEYRRAMLAGKLLNSVNETPEADILAGESFKAIVSGDVIVGRHIRQSPIQFRPIAGHAFSANRLPGTTDMSPGFWRRIVVIYFTRRFLPHEQVPDLADQIVEHELPVVASWFLAGAARAVRHGRFTVPSSSDTAVAEWRREADQVALYVEERLEAEANPKLATGGSTLYSDYREWAEKTGHRPLAIQKFAGRMRLLGHPGERGREGTTYPVRIKTAAFTGGFSLDV